MRLSTDTFARDLGSDEDWQLTPFGPTLRTHGQSKGCPVENDSLCSICLRRCLKSHQPTSCWVNSVLTATMMSALENYEAERVALIAHDRSLRIGFNQGDNLTVVEAKADWIIRDIRAKEASSIWGAEYESIPHPFPGMEFLTGKRIILKTKLFQILRKLPKGGLLHAHLGGMVDPKVLLSMSLPYPSIHIRVPNTLTLNNLRTTIPEFRPLPTSQFAKSSSLSDAGAGNWVGLQAARENFDPSLGGKDGFDEWLIGCMTINPAEAYGTHNIVIKIWEKFESTFTVLRGLFYYAPIWETYLKEFLLSSIDDGISYIEVRLNFLRKFMYGAEGLPSVPHRDWISMFIQVVNEVKKDMKAQGREEEFVGAKVIYAIVKVVAPELVWYLEDCVQLKKEFPDIIAGFDLVGGEDCTSIHPLKDYLSQLLHFRDLQKEAGVEISFLLHAGESLGDGTEADENMYDAVLLGTKRIGHGFSIVKHPRLMEICKERGIALEVCPIANEILRLTSSMPMHPLPIMLSHGITVALGSDAPAIFGNMGLSFDFYQVLASSEVNGLTTLRELARASIKHSMMNDSEKECALAAWERRWLQFVDDISRDETY